MPITVALMSRLQTKKEQKKIISAIQEGSIDIVMGTHRILSNDIVFKNLQLLIIDDEQRFGVKQKEKLRHKNPSLDMLSLSATPIPRTMYLALSSFKNISLMQTPPEGRTAIHTKVMPYRKDKIRQAIDAELARGGQVYFLHNRVQTIEKTMRIDLPNVNTIIIEDASRLGLAQAYQIRGRVGRSRIKSFAYLFYPKKLTAAAKERLKALSQARQLGSGYQVAMKDLELRGAGNILGKEQSGSINKIGLNLYCQMLAEAVEKIKE